MKMKKNNKVARFLDILVTIWEYSVFPIYFGTLILCGIMKWNVWYALGGFFIYLLISQYFAIKLVKLSYSFEEPIIIPDVNSGYTERIRSSMWEDIEMHQKMLKSKRNKK